MKESILSILRLSVGALLFSISLALFLEPASIVTGGVSGVAIILAHLVPLSVGLLFFFLNLPMLLIGLRVFGVRFMLATLYATVLSSCFTEILTRSLSFLLPLTESPLLASALGGILCGAGIGLVMREGGTTGGTDIGVRLLRLKFSRIREGVFFFIIDYTVVLASAFVFHSVQSILYSTAALILCSVTVDAILYKPRKR